MWLYTPTQWCAFGWYTSAPTHTFSISSDSYAVDSSGTCPMTLPAGTPVGRAVNNGGTIVRQ